MFVDVAVCGAKDPGKSTYTYYTDKRLHVGTLVEVSFGKKRTYGVVMATKDETTVRGILPVLRVPLSYPLYSERQLTFFKEIVLYYHTSVSVLLSLVLPKFPKAVLATDVQWHNVHSKQKQRLILAPTVFKLKEVIALFTLKKQPFHIYSSELSVTERAQAFLDVRQTTVETIIATRSGLFLPFQNLQGIYMYDEHDWAYRELRDPAYHAFTVAYKMAEFTNVPCTIIDPTPRVQTWWLGQKPPTSVVLRQTKTVSQKPSIETVDLVVEKGKGNTGLLSPQLIAAIESCVKSGRPVLLYLNKKNDGGLVYCKHCQFTAYTTIPPTQCPQCKSEQLKVTVINLKHVAKACNSRLRLWGYQNQTKTDGWQVDKEGSILSYYANKRLLITIATQKILYQAHYGTYNLVGVVLADTLTNLPEFRANEKSYITLAQLYRLLQPNTHSHLVIQTSNPDHPVFRFFMGHDYGGFVKEELLERQALNYPPFSLPILLRFEAKTRKTAIEHATGLLQQFEAMQNASNDTVPVEIIGPYSAEQTGATTLHKTHEMRILLKAENRLAAQPYLSIVPKSWRIIIDPENLVT